MHFITRIVPAGLCASLLIIGTNTPGGVFGKPARDVHQEDFQETFIQNVGININQVNYRDPEADQEQKGCLKRYRTTLICGFTVCIIAVPAIYELVAFIQNIQAKASLVADACATMERHCDTLDQDCTLLNGQVKMVVQLLASLTKITPEQVTCILSCSQINTTLIEKLSCIALCIKA
jgi:hypothetical protein